MSQIKQNNHVGRFHYRDQNYDEVVVNRAAGGEISIQKDGTEILRLSAINDVSVGPDIWLQANGIIACESSLYLLIDSNNDSTNAALIIGKDTETNGATELVRVGENGRVGVGTNSPSALLDVNSDTIRLRTSKTPASATAAGNAGNIAWDSNYVYVCVAANTWKRAALATW